MSCNEWTWSGELGQGAGGARVRRGSPFTAVKSYTFFPLDFPSLTRFALDEPATATMSRSTVQPNGWVGLRLPNDILRLLQVVPNTSVAQLLGRRFTD